MTFVCADVHFSEKLRRDEVVRVKNCDIVIFSFHFKQPLKEPFKRIALTAFLVTVPLVNSRALRARNFGGSVGAVVGNNKYVIAVLRVILIF